jgi:hypothetical protein
MGSNGVEVILDQFSRLDGDGSELTSSSMLACAKGPERRKLLRLFPRIFIKKVYQRYREDFIQ